MIRPIETSRPTHENNAIKDSDWSAGSAGLACIATIEIWFIVAPCFWPLTGLWTDALTAKSFRADCLKSLIKAYGRGVHGCALSGAGIGVRLQAMQQEGGAIAWQDFFLGGLLRAVTLPDLFGPALFGGLAILRRYR